MTRVTAQQDTTASTSPTGSGPSHPVADLGVTVSAFPGRLVTGVSMIVGPVCAVIATALAMDIYSADGTTFIREIADNFVRFQIALNFQLVSFVLLIFAVAGLAQTIVPVSPRLGKTAGVMTMAGMMGPIFFEGIYWGGSHLTSAATQPAAAQLYDASQLPSIIMNYSGPAMVAGYILLAIAAARSGVLSRPFAIILGITCIFPAGFISGYMVIASVAFVACAVALVPLGLRVLRTPSAP